MKEPEIHVGILSAERIDFTLNAPFRAEGQTVCGSQQVTAEGNRLRWNGKTYRELFFTPVTGEEASFSIHQVTIGIHFHWERKETQTFTGRLRFIAAEGKVTAVNQLPAEDYLTSVISSEMNAASPPEFLKAHAVISRSWLLAQISRQASDAYRVMYSGHSVASAENEYIRWYDHEDHTLFHVCADDHCQRYQGITKASTPAVKAAIEATRGEVLTYGGVICDARFSKCCGGVTEVFSTCWEDKNYPYLRPVRDAAEPSPLPDLSREEEAEQWIRHAPDALCNTRDAHLLSVILNDYDRATTDFYRWRVTYAQEELSALICRKTGIDFGKILRLTAVERGKSGRICKLKITGSRRTAVIGKELEIRKALSATHLFSSAFVVDYGAEHNGAPETFTLTGAGWGHGVGLCQIGAAVMGERGYRYTDILLHYYKGATLSKLYE